MTRRRMVRFGRTARRQTAGWPTFSLIFPNSVRNSNRCNSSNMQAQQQAQQAELAQQQQAGQQELAQKGQAGQQQLQQGAQAHASKDSASGGSPRAETTAGERSGQPETSDGDQRNPTQVVHENKTKIIIIKYRIWQMNIEHIL